MTNEEREALHAGITTIIAILSGFELRILALETALRQTNPNLYSEYQKSLGMIPATTINTTLECLNKNLLRTSR